VCIGLLAFLVYILFDLRIDREVQEQTTMKEADKFSIRDIGSILSNRAYIYILLLCVTFYSAVFPFLAYAPDFLLNKFGITAVESGKIARLIPLGTMFFTPLFGFMIDRKGRAATAMILGAIILMLVHLVFAYTSLAPHVFMILLGVSFSLVPAAMWPSMIKLVREKEIGTAYGMMYSVQNLGLWATPIIAGRILDQTNPGMPATLNYTPTLLLFVGLSVLGLLFGLMLRWENSRRNFGMELPLNKK
jgi:predicted MFS family arabinose efflux permease